MRYERGIRPEQNSPDPDEPDTSIRSPRSILDPEGCGLAWARTSSNEVMNVGPNELSTQYQHQDHGLEYDLMCKSIRGLLMYRVSKTTCIIQFGLVPPLFVRGETHLGGCATPYLIQHPLGRHFLRMLLHLSIFSCYVADLIMSITGERRDEYKQQSGREVMEEEKGRTKWTSKVEVVHF